MRRELSFEEISDGHRYKSRDLVKLPCNSCSGCSECCSVTDDTIHLDPYDVYMLSKGLNSDFSSLLKSCISLTVVDGVITPYLSKNNTGNCSFLNSEGLCGIHIFRPGFCRLFPLGRIYNEDDSFDYFLQVHECPSKVVSKQRVDKWLGIADITQYEDFILKWHNIVVSMRDFSAECDDSEMLEKAQMRMLTIFFTTPYDSSQDFFLQFNERLSNYSK